MDDLDARVRKAVRHFWRVRRQQSERQGQASGRRDAGMRTAVTGGKHLDGFVQLCREILTEAGLHDAEIFWKSQLELPGYFRPEKNWDLLAVVDGQLVAVIEFKAQVGPSFGNNFNNRTEEALGNATDLWAAYREGAYKPSQRPWLGYVFILEECARSTAPVKVREPHFQVFPEFDQASYARRYEILLTRLLRERLYDGACLLLTKQTAWRRGQFSTPSDELSFQNFAIGLSSHAAAHSKLR